MILTIIFNDRILVEGWTGGKPKARIRWRAVGPFDGYGPDARAPDHGTRLDELERALVLAHPSRESPAGHRGRAGPSEKVYRQVLPPS